MLPLVVTVATVVTPVSVSPGLSRVESATSRFDVFKFVPAFAVTVLDDPSIITEALRFAFAVWFTVVDVEVTG